MKIESGIKKKIDMFLKKSELEGVKRLCTGIIVYKNQKVLMIRRVPHDFMGGHYELAGGGVEENAEIVLSVCRECEDCLHKRCF